MSQENKILEVDTPKDHLAPLKCVTPLSKYLAMMLFIILPFLGGLVGYEYVPKKEDAQDFIYEINTNTDIKIDKSEQKNTKKVGQNIPIQLKSDMVLDYSKYPEGTIQILDVFDNKVLYLDKNSNSVILINVTTPKEPITMMENIDNRLKFYGAIYTDSVIVVSIARNTCEYSCENNNEDERVNGITSLFKAEGGTYKAPEFFDFNGILLPGSSFYFRKGKTLEDHRVFFADTRSLNYFESKNAPFIYYHVSKIYNFSQPNFSQYISTGDNVGYQLTELGLVRNTNTRNMWYPVQKSSVTYSYDIFSKGSGPIIIAKSEDGGNLEQVITAEELSEKQKDNKINNTQRESYLYFKLPWFLTNEAVTIIFPYKTNVGYLNINDVISNNQNVWLNTNQGLVLFNSESLDYSIFRTSEGLINDTIYNMWFGRYLILEHPEGLVLYTR